MREYYDAIAYLPQKLHAILSMVTPNIAQNITEIRLRSGCPIVLTLCNGFAYVKQNGITAQSLSGDLLYTNAQELEACVLALCGYSVYSVQDSINKGFIPIGGGHRAGVCGTACIGEDGKITVNNITSVNIRVARRDSIYCDERVKNILRRQTIGLLIAGAPASGKTTVLKSIIDELSHIGKRVAIVDERRELAPTQAQEHCDVLSQYPKDIGMLQAIRSLSPEIIVCDEIGGMSDAIAIQAAANAGVSIVMSVHAQDEAALYKRPQIRAILLTGAFDTVCFLHGANKPSVIERIVQNDAFTQIIRACHGEPDGLSFGGIQSISA